MHQVTSGDHIEISFVRITRELPGSVYQFYLDKLPPELQDRNNCFLRWQDRHAHLIGKLLLLSASIRLGSGSRALHDLKYNDYGKPALDYFSFNISHSGEFVICACSTSRVKLGVDIERKKPIRFDDFLNTMDDAQWAEINADPDRALDRFYAYWVIKESVIKAIGQGLSFPLTDIVISNNFVSVKRDGFRGNITEFSLHPDYAMAMVTDSAIAKDDISLTELTIDQL